MSPESSEPTSRVERLAAELAFITEMAGVIASNTELQPILDWMVQKTTGMLSADEGSVRLIADEPTAAPKTVVRKAAAGLASGSWPPGIAMSVMGFLAATGQPLVTPDLTADPRFSGLANLETRIRAALVVPLRVENRLTGMLAVTQTTPGRQWTADEVQLLSIVAAHSAGAIEQARLRAESVEKKRIEEQMKRQERDLELARDIQTRLLPTEPFRAGSWLSCGCVVPARHVGGDAFDCYALGGGRFAVGIADVSGKGVPASLLMSSFQASLRAYCDGRQPPAQGIGLVNQAIARTIADGAFITAFYAEIDEAKGTLRYVNAGHNPPLLRRASGELVELGAGELALGILAESAYTEHETPFALGDALLLFSDGVTEAFNLRQEMFGEPRLRDAWARLGAGAPAAAIAAILAEVQQFRGIAEQSDDITLVAVGAAD